MVRQLTLTEELAYTTVRISTLGPSGHNGSGTGFIFQFCHDGKQSIPAIVTNKHVLDGAVEAVIHFSVKDPAGDPEPKTIHAVRIRQPARGRIDHPDPNIDLTALPFGSLVHELNGAGVTPFFRSFAFSNLPTEAELNDLGAMEPVVMIGYPIGLWDHINNQPIIRRGVTATHPCLDFQGKPEFVIDCACWPGSSGSPVVLYNDSGYVSRAGDISMTGPRVRFLGVLYAGPQFDAQGEVTVTDIPTVGVPLTTTKLMVNLGYVIKATQLRAIDDLLATRRSQHSEP
jgi:hypothetical protein